MAESGGPDLDEAAIVAVRQWTFVPAMRGGKPVASRIKMPFHFAPPAPPPELVTPAPTPATLPDADRRPAGARAGACPRVDAPPAAPEPSEVQVRGRLEAREHGASDFKQTLGELEAVPRAERRRALELAPGFLLTNEGGEGHAEQVFLRGFDAREGQDLEFSVDGVPVNEAGNYHGNGYADTHFIIPELVESVRVLEGPFDPQQGNYAVAGSADYHLGLDRRGLTATYTTGSYGTQRLLLLWGPSEGPTGTFAGVEYFTTDGFGANRHAKRGTAMGQYEIPVGAKGVLRVNATAYATEYDSAGVVRDDDYQSGRVGFYGTEDASQVGNTATRASIAATYENRFQAMDVSSQLFVVDRTMRLLEDWTGFLGDVQLPTQTPHAQRGRSRRLPLRRGDRRRAWFRALARRGARGAPGARGWLLRPDRRDHVHPAPRHGGQRRPVPHRRRPQVDPRRRGRLRRRQRARLAVARPARRGPRRHVPLRRPRTTARPTPRKA